MGLDALVFRNVRHLEDRLGRGLFDVDGTTGEATVNESAGISAPRSAFIAIRCRIGNAAEIAVLQRAVATLLSGHDSLILSRVLYSGSHAGDSIMPSDHPRLRLELSRLKASDDSGTQLFIRAMESLLDAAEAEQNPIVFV